MPGPSLSDPSRWMQCVTCGEGQTPLRSLTSLEEQLELSFSQLRQTLGEVRSEIASLQTEPAVLESPVIESVRLGPELDVVSEVSSELISRSLALAEHPCGLEVPPMLRHHLRDRQDPASKAAWIAADRAKALVQGADLLAPHEGEGQGLRLHPRWMEMATKSKMNFHHKLIHRRTQRHVGAWVGQTLSQTTQLEAAQAEEEAMHPNMQPKCLLLPSSAVRVCWDLLGLLLIVLDAFMVPISLAWDVGIEPVDTGSTLMCIAFLTSLSYWSTDVVMTLNTGFYYRGRLVRDRGQIFCHYLQTWLIFDLVLISLDVSSAVYQFALTGARSSSEQEQGMSILQGLRALRTLRAFRLLRLLKMSRLSSVIEEASVAVGRQWLVLVVAIVNTTLTAVLCAHVLACGWYLLGRDSVGSWLDLTEATPLPGPIQYLHAMQWVLMPPSPPPVSADNVLERLYCIIIVGSTVVVIGSALSKITGTLAELRTINSEGSRRRREVRQYLHAQHVSLELTSRIMRFVDYKLGRQSSVVLDPSLLSPSLVIELQVSQRGAQLTPHPLFAIIHDAFPEAFAAICGAVEKHVFGKMETVFAEESWARHMWITTTGRFLHNEAADTGQDAASPADSQSLKELQWNVVLAGEWFAEAALFAEAITHDSTLRAETFGEAFSLKGSDLVRTLMNSPTCTAMVCEYSKDLLAKLNKKQSPDKATWSSKDAEDLSYKCLKQNSFYQEVHPDPRTVLDDFDLFNEEPTERDPAADEWHKEESMFSNVKNEVARRIRAGRETLMKAEPSNSSKEASANETQQNSNSSLNLRRSASVLSGKILRNLAGELLSKKVGMAEAGPTLLEGIPELSPQHGTYVLFEQNSERDKSESSCMSLMALLVGSYEDFVRPQAAEVRLKEAQWQELQELVSWTHPSESKVRAALVLLAIRSLGKCKRIVQQLPQQAHRPEQALIYLIRNYTNVVPSVHSLGEEQVDLMSDALDVHKDFNLAQMLQGENVPASVKQLQEMVQRLGIEIFRFYILFLLGFMSGLAGGNGSRFMNARNASAIILAVKTLRHILDSSPQAIYWSFIELRARQLFLPHATPEDIALVRLGCLARVQDLSGYQSVRASWMLLGLRERQLLAKHFLSDGIEESAFLCEFLPDCVGKARENRNVGLHLLLEVLVHLIEHLQRADRKINPENNEVHMISVDLSDFAEFISVVQNRFVFSTCISRCGLSMESARRWYLQMTSANWSRTHEKDTDTTTLAYGVKELLQRQKFLQEVITSPTAPLGDGHAN